MNETVVLRRLAEIMADAANIDSSETEKFIQAFFAHLEDALAVSEEVTIDGLGTFSRTIDSEQVISFTIDPELAAAINEPFEMFEPMPVGEADLSMTDNTTPSDEDLPDEAEVEIPIPVTPTPAEPAKIKDEEAAVAHAATIVIEETITVEQPPQPLSTTHSYDIEDVSHEEAAHHRSHTFIWSVITFIIGLGLGAVMAFFGHDRLVNAFSPVKPEMEILTREEPADTATEIITEEATIAVPDSIMPSVDTVEEPHITEERVQVYDTVTPNRFLTTMARQYYGPMEYWVFIYEANAELLGDPNRIKPGTRVAIPDRSDFETDSTQQQTIARAKRLGREIYDRFK